MFNENDLDLLQAYMLWDDNTVDELVDGPNHKRLLQAVMSDKLSSGIMRERLIARYLGLDHNSRMHSTTKGVTTFDATDPTTGIHYEVKAEQYTSNNPNRSTQNGQLSGTGIFPVTNQEGIDKLIANNPMIAHGMFMDGRLLCLVTFRLLSSNGINRITEYCLSSKKTAPRYTFSDWKDCPDLTVHYLCDYWPDKVVPKYKKFFTGLKSKHQSIMSLQVHDLSESTKSHPSL